MKGTRSMINCKDCKFWKRNKINLVSYQHNRFWEYDRRLTEYKIIESKETKFGSCLNDKLKYTMSGGSIEDDDLDPDNTDDMLIYSDGEAYGAYLFTGENFGCIHGKKQE